MKTKLIWEQSDIQVGRWVYYAGRMSTTMDHLHTHHDLDFCISTAHMIVCKVNADSPNTFPMIALTDGRIYDAGHDIDSLANWLTQEDYIPLPPELLIKLIQRKFKLSTLSES